MCQTQFACLLILSLSSNLSECVVLLLLLIFPFVNTFTFPLIFNRHSLIVSLSLSLLNFSYFRITSLVCSLRDCTTSFTVTLFVADVMKWHQLNSLYFPLYFIGLEAVMTKGVTIHWVSPFVYFYLSLSLFLFLSFVDRLPDTICWETEKRECLL